MRRLMVVSAVALTVAFTPSRASAQTCSNPSQIGDACAVASDFFRYMAPQFGTAIAGGSHTLGIGTNLGGFPHFAVALRANAVLGNFPTIDNVQLGAANPRNFAVEDGGAAMVTADFALGLTKGFNVGVTRIGGIDLIGGVTYVPTLEEDNFTLTPQSNVSVGLGARVGLLQQSALIPGVAFSYMKRDLPTVDLTSSADDGSTFDLNDFSIKTSSWRLSAQKNLLLFQLGAGIGGDTYDFSTAATVNVVDGPLSATGSFSDKASMSRTTMYGSLGLNLFLVKVVIEGGQVSGGSIATQNTFDTPADEKRLYANVGLRISF
ncbi:hypothetical protein Strain138_001314 [Pseudogemmatithrix spongiicola]|uniref:Outer membrane protein beta-barrel domain-containing protein n=1 Tax=Pseudogemmatithrix spongiicola TaxID=3062599 RepID=A0AA49Q4N6_9BACT|nr:hypothetical protein Strain138_001314 [Gemmatimonadaceae bacterium 'strain 138']WKW14951.1 hypothetical protein Strain318_001314 [Gemmatimonadaceae bacterium 'strain 318']